MEVITQTNRTMLFEEINPEKLNLLTLVGDAKDVESLDDAKIKEIRDFIRDKIKAGLESEEGIEGNNAVDFRNGNSGALGNNLLYLQGYVAVFLLNVAQNYNERSFFRNIAVAYFVNLCNRGFA